MPLAWAWAHAGLPREFEIACSRVFNLPESFERLSPKGAEKTAVRSVRQRGMALSSPASSPCLCTPWAKSRPRAKAGPPDTLTAADLRDRARTRRSDGLSTGAPRSYRLEERCVPPAGFSGPRMASREPESPVSCGGAAARTRSRLCECSDHLRHCASQCTSRGHAARHERVLLDQRARWAKRRLRPSACWRVRSALRFWLGGPA